MGKPCLLETLTTCLISETIKLISFKFGTVMFCVKLCSADPIESVLYMELRWNSCRLFREKIAYHKIDGKVLPVLNQLSITA
jgi:hypothetical protein